MPRSRRVDAARPSRGIPPWREPGMPALILATAFAFAGFSVLMPVAPMHAVALGGDALLAGLVNAVLMGVTILTQLNVERLRPRLGWSMTLALACILLGIPAIVEIFATDVSQVIALAAVRGIGFGIITVSGSSAIGVLFPPGRRGRAVGIWGLAIALPQLLFTPAAPWVVDNGGFGVALTIGALPVIGVPFAIAAGRQITAHTQPPVAVVEAVPGSHMDAGPEPDNHTDAGIPPTTGGLAVAHVEVRRALVRLLPPIIALMVVTCVGGAISTFTPQFTGEAVLSLIALLAFTGVAAFARWFVGGLADRFGARRFVLPGVLAALTGSVLIAAGLAVGAGGGAALLVAGTAVAGAAFGTMQNVTLVRAFELAGEHARSTASTAWNVAFDAGTGLGALAIGALAAGTSFTTAFLVLAAVCLGVAVALAWLPRRAGGRAGDETREDGHKSPSLE